MTTDNLGRARTKEMSEHDRQQQAKNQRYREMLAGHEVDDHSYQLDMLIEDLHLVDWYCRPVPEGEEYSPKFWRTEKSRQYRHLDIVWKDVRYDEQYVIARRQLVKKAFAQLNPRERLAIAICYGLLDGRHPSYRQRKGLVSRQMEIAYGTAAKLTRQTLLKLLRICHAIAIDPIPADPNPATTRIETLDFGVKLYNILKKLKIQTLQDLTSGDWTDAHQLMNLRNFGKTCLIELCQTLKAWGQPLPRNLEYYIDIESI